MTRSRRQRCAQPHYGALKPEQRAIRTVWEELAIAIEGRTIVTTDAIVLQAIQSTLEARQSRDAWRYTLSHVRNQAKAAGGWFVGDRIQARRWPEHVDPVRNAYIITNDSELAKLSHVEIAESHKLEVGSIMDVARRLTNDQAI